MSEIVKALLQIAELLKDPLLIVLVFVIVMLAYFLRRVLDVLFQKIEENRALEREVHETNEVIAKLVTLVEVLVYGREKK